MISVWVLLYEVLLDDVRFVVDRAELPLRRKTSETWMQTCRLILCVGFSFHFYHFGWTTRSLLMMKRVTGRNFEWIGIYYAAWRVYQDFDGG